MRILIADDHAVVRHGLKVLLAAEFKGAVFGEASGGYEALNLVWQHNWDVVVLDLSMPGRSGLEVLKEIKKVRPKLPVVILSMHPEDQFAIRLLKAGAAAYLTKETAPEQLVSAIRKVVAGGRYVSTALAEKMVYCLGIDVQAPPHERLSDREFLVLRLIGMGKTVAVIARELSLSVKTVSTYRMRTLQKMGLASTAALIRYAIQNNLVEAEPGEPRARLAKPTREWLRIHNRGQHSRN